ncbi:hypothetical protein KC926_02645 [Candidatus Kaiserbacteria bacterium]|nr:hypothetical protein [Candidatus Kaiserbacteria bacterium]
MNYIDHVPCSDQKHHTAFVLTVDEPEKGVLVASFTPADNFMLANIGWLQEFTDEVTTQLQKDYPGKVVVFHVN